jgi:hypothetical protein
MDVKTITVIAYAMMVLGIIPVVVGAIRVSGRPAYLNLLWGLTIVSFVCDMGQILSGRGYRNVFGNSYRLLEFILLLAVYYYALDRRNWKWYFIVAGISFVVFYSCNALFWQKSGPNSYAPTVSALVFIVISLFYFYSLMRDLPGLRLSVLPMFWTSIGVLIYFAGSLFVFALFNYMASSLKKELILYWLFHNVLDLTKNILFAVALWPRPTTPKLR